MADCTQKFINYLVDQTPHFAPDILRAIHPMSGTWLGKVKTERWPSFAGNVHYFDKYEQVFVNPVRQWVPKEYAACQGTPCDYNADQIGWGNSRYSFFKEQRSIETPLICFDQIRDVSHARENLQQIVNDILKPATDTIMSYYIKKRAAIHAKNKIVANHSMTPFTFDWAVSGENEVYIDTNVAPTAVAKLTPQHLQRMVMPLTLAGYMDVRVLSDDFPRLMELITDMETCWELDKQATTAGSGSTGLNAYWRYDDWTTANQYWRYGFSGQLGNYAVSVDPFALRFQYVGIVSGKYRYQVILPYRNVSAETTDGNENWVSGSGLRMEPNPDYELAQYQFTYVWHRAAGTVYVADAESVHPNMPFMARDLAGKWYFSNTDLGCENVRKNKGKFWADFELAWRPSRPELSAIFFHRREPAVIPTIYPSADAPPASDQTYSAAPSACTLWWELPTLGTGQGYVINNGDIYVDGNPIAFGGTGCVATLAALVTALNGNTVTAALGTWAAADPDNDGTQELTLQSPTSGDIDVIINVCTL